MQKTIVNVKTQEEYNTLMEHLEDLGGEWCNGEKPTHEKYWSQYKENTCINVSNIKELVYSNVSFYINDNRIITLNQYLSYFIGKGGIIYTNIKNNAGNSTIKTFMTNFKTLIKDLTRTEPNNTLIKAGILDSDESLTPLGVEALQDIVYKAHINQLVELANQIITAQEEKK